MAIPLTFTNGDVTVEFWATWSYNPVLRKTEINLVGYANQSGEVILHSEDVSEVVEQFKEEQYRAV
jgi:hypothetical protein